MHESFPDVDSEAIRAADHLLAVVAAFAISGCGNSTTPPSSTVADLTVTSTVVNGRSHTVNVPSGDQLHPADMTDTSSSTLNHTHTVTLTASQLASIASGGTVTVTSSVSTVTGTHTHDFTFQGKK
jgi:hypothetical protein